MSAGAITAGEAYVSVTCDDAGLVAGLRESSAQIQATARKIAAMQDDLTVSVGVEGVGALESALTRIEGAVKRTGVEMEAAFSVAAQAVGSALQRVKTAVWNATNEFGAFGDSFDKMAGRVGFSAEALSEYAYAATMRGADISNVEGAVKGMQTTLADAASGGADAAEKLSRLSLSAERLSQLSPEAQFDVISTAIARIVDPTERAARAMEIFGDDGQVLLPMFAEGADGMRAMREEARELGVALSGDASNGASEYVSATTRLQTAIRGASLAFSEALAPTIAAAAEGLASAVAWCSRLVREFPKLTKYLTNAAAGFAALTAGAYAWVAYKETITTAIDNLKKAFLLLRTAAVGACREIGVALTWLRAHPALGLAAAIGAAIAAIRAYRAARDASLGRTAWSEEAAGALEAGNAIREQDEGRLARLRELAEKQTTSKSEIAEAVGLVAELKSRYGDVGIAVDATTGKIRLAAEAQAELNRRMLEAKRAETQAALDEAKANAEPGTIARKMADEEVGFVEGLVGKRRGESWFNYIFDWEITADPGEAKLQIANGDENFRKRVKSAEDKNKAAVERLEAELAGLDAVLAAPIDSTGSTAAAPDDPLAAMVDDYVDSALDEVDAAKLNPLERKIADIEAEGEKLKDKLREALAPDLDWTNAAAVAAWWGANPEEFARLCGETERIDEATASRVEAVQNEDAAERRKKESEEAARQEEEASRKIAEFEARRDEEGKSNAEKRIDAIRKETAEYKDALNAALALERAKPDGERDDARVATLEGKVDAADADGKRREGAVLAEAQEAYFEKFATPFEKFAKARSEFEAATRELREAQASGDERRFAAALEKQGEARSKYESAESAISQATVAAEATATKPIVGTFSAYQAADVYGAANDWDKRALEESKEQTRLLREISRRSAGGATFA